jgi:thiol-disulfide isomerase/thioredoxin
MKLFHCLLFSILGVLFLNINMATAHDGAEFSDLSHEDPYYEIIMSLNRMGIVMGNAQGLINGESSLNRAELVVIVIRAARIQVKDTDKNCFPDVQEQWFAGPICAMVRMGWISGYPDGLFRPAREVTVGESAKITVNALTLSQFTDLQQALDYIESNGFTMVALSIDVPIVRKEAFARLYNVTIHDMQQMDSEGNPFNPAEDTIITIEEGGPVYYIEYNETQYQRHLGKDPIILFFHAAWCPLCRASEETILAHQGELVGGAVIFKVDFDSELALRKTYGITTQDTLVAIDSSGEDLLHFSAIRNKGHIQSLIDISTTK